jgi:hypothetical protein
LDDFAGTAGLGRAEINLGITLGACLGAALATGLATGFAEVTTDLTVTDLAGEIVSADAQIVTLLPFTWEPTLFEPEEPPEFLHAA